MKKTTNNTTLTAANNTCAQRSTAAQKSFSSAVRTVLAVTPILACGLTAAEKAEVLKDFSKEELDEMLVAPPVFTHGKGKGNRRSRSVRASKIAKMVVYFIARKIRTYLNHICKTKESGVKFDLQFFAAGTTKATDNSGSAELIKEELNMKKGFNRIYSRLEKQWIRDDVYSARKSYIVNVLEITKLKDKRWTATQRTQVMYESEFTRAYAKVKELKQGDLIQDLLLINFPNEQFNEVELMLNVYKAENKFYYATEDKKAEIQSVFDEVGEQLVFNCFTEKTSAPQLRNMMTLNKVGSSPSSFRGKTMMYVEPSNQMEQIINLASHGAYFKMKAMGEVFTWAQRQKMEVRVWQCLSPSTAVDVANTIAIYGGKEGKGYVEDSLAIFQIEEELVDIVDIAGRKVLDKEAFEKFVNKHKLAITVCDTISCADIEELLKASELCQLKGTSDGVLHNNRNDMIYKRNWSNVVGSMQGRPASAKAMVVATTQRSVDSKVTALDENPIRILRKDITIQQEKWLDDLLFGMAKKDNPYIGRVVIICDNLNAPVELLGDLNAYKCAWDYRVPSVIPCLDAPKLAKASLSKQAANKLFGLNAQKAYELIKNILEENIQELIDQFYDTKVTGFKELKNLYPAGIITGAYKDALKVDPALKRSMVKTLLNQIKKILNDFKAEIKDSATQRAVADPAALYGFRVLKDTEMFSKDVPVGVKVLLLKYPTAAPKEGMIFTNIGLQEILDRISKLNVSDEIKNALADDYRCIESGCGVVSACKRNMKLLAGMDYDWDQFMAIWLKAIIDFLVKEKFQPEMVDINPGKVKDSGKRYAINLDTLGLAQVKDIRSEGENVGGCTVKGDAFIQMHSVYNFYEGNNTYQSAIIKLLSSTFDCAYALSARNDEDIAYTNRDRAIAWAVEREEIIIPEYKNIGAAKAPSVAKATSVNKPIALTDRNGDFVGFKVNRTRNFSRVFIDGALKEKVRYSFKTCVITKNNLDLIFEASDQVLHHDQEIIIDSPKTSITTDAMCDTTSVFKCFGRKRYDYEIENNKIFRKSINLGKTYFFMDLFAKIRDELEFKMIPKVQAILDAQEDMTHEVMSEIGAILNATNNNNEELEKVKTGLYLSQVYSEVYKALMALPRETQRDQEYYTERKAFLTKYMEALYNMFRTLMGDAKTLERSKYAYLFAAYCLDKKGNIVAKTSKNCFDTSVAGKEMIFYYAKMFGGLALVGSKIAIATEDILSRKFVSAKNGRIFDQDGNYVGVAKDKISKERLVVVKRNDSLYVCDDLHPYVDFDYDNSMAAIMLPTSVAKTLEVGKAYKKSDFNLAEPVTKLIKGSEVEVTDISIAISEIEISDAFGYSSELVESDTACVLIKVINQEQVEEDQEEETSFSYEVSEENMQENCEFYDSMDQEFCDSLVNSSYVEEEEAVYVSNFPMF